MQIISLVKTGFVAACGLLKLFVVGQKRYHRRQEETSCPGLFAEV
jgi:hypothetical protein